MKFEGIFRLTFWKAVAIVLMATGLAAAVDRFAVGLGAATNLKDTLYFARINSKSVSRKYTEIQDKNFVICAKLHYEAFTNQEYSIELIRVLVNRMNKDLLTILVSFRYNRLSG